MTQARPEVAGQNHCIGVVGMKPRTIHQLGRAVGLPVLCLAASAAAQDVSIVNSQSFDIEYAVNEAALPLSSVALWYTTDGGVSWTEFGRDEDRISPIRFRAPGEGPFGFYFVLTNSSGPSGPPPGKNTPPQQLALVDFTPPLVQLHQAKAVAGVDDITVQIRWTAVDAYFSPRPIEVIYGSHLEDVVHRATPEPVANTGMLDWRVPAEVSGSIAIKVVATDRSGQRVESEALWVDVEAPAKTATIQANVHSVSTVNEQDDSALAGSARARTRAAELYTKALEDSKLGRPADGVARLREAVKLDPHMTQAFAEMGGMLYALGDLDRATGAFEIALKQEPNNRDALRGLARIQERRGSYPAAATQLQTILRYNPKDSEVWLQLGDVAVLQGDEIRARECYLRAAQIDPQATAVVADARQRLALMTELSRNPGARK